MFLDLRLFPRDSKEENKILINVEGSILQLEVKLENKNINNQVSFYNFLLKQSILQLQ